MMGDTTKPGQRRPGEKPRGKYPYNPGSMLGETVDTVEDEAERENIVDRLKGGRERVKERESGSRSLAF
jgi:hypothetical protein